MTEKYNRQYALWCFYKWPDFFKRSDPICCQFQDSVTQEWIKHKRTIDFMSNTNRANKSGVISGADNKFRVTKTIYSNQCQPQNYRVRIWERHIYKRMSLNIIKSVQSTTTYTVMVTGETAHHKKTYTVW